MCDCCLSSLPRSVSLFAFCLHCLGCVAVCSVLGVSLFVCTVVGVAAVCLHCLLSWVCCCLHCLGCVIVCCLHCLGCVTVCCLSALTWVCHCLSALPWVCRCLSALSWVCRCLLLTSAALECVTTVCWSSLPWSVSLLLLVCSRARSLSLSEKSCSQHLCSGLTGATLNKIFVLICVVSDVLQCVMCPLSFKMVCSV